MKNGFCFYRKSDKYVLSGPGIVWETIADVKYAVAHDHLSGLDNDVNSPGYYWEIEQQHESYEAGSYAVLSGRVVLSGNGKPDWYDDAKTWTPENEY